MASTYLTRTPSSAGNRKTFTLSFWIKRGNLSSQQHIAYASGYTEIRFTSDDKTMFRDAGGNFGLSDAVFRDVSAWYHIVYAIDTTQATESNRIKLYVNGEQFTVTTFPTLNFDFAWNNNVEHQIGASSGAEFFNGSMSHIHFIDGTAELPTAFGEYDANGVWKIKTSPSVTYGTNGFFILKDGNSVTDQSGEGNNFTVAGGTLTNTEDNPSNVFNTFNSLDNFYANATFSNGNNTVVTNASAFATSLSTLGMSSGKYYCEIKAVTIYNGYARFGISGSQASSNGFGNAADEYVFMANNGQKRNNSTTSAYSGVAWNNNDIIGIAVDLDNNYIYFSRNGSWINSGNPASGASGTNAAFTLGTPSTGFYYFGVNDADNAASSENTYQANFGNGYFGTTAVASAGTNASGIGIFEYDVPTGYTALSTKGLNL